MERDRSDLSGRRGRDGGARAARPRSAGSAALARQVLRLVINMNKYWTAIRP